MKRSELLRRLAFFVAIFQKHRFTSGATGTFAPKHAFWISVDSNLQQELLSKSVFQNRCISVFGKYEFATGTFVPTRCISETKSAFRFNSSSKTVLEKGA